MVEAMKVADVGWGVSGREMAGFVLAPNVGTDLVTGSSARGFLGVPTDGKIANLGGSPSANSPIVCDLF